MEEAQDLDLLDLLPDSGRAPQLLWASGSASVKWRDACASCPFSELELSPCLPFASPNLRTPFWKQGFPACPLGPARASVPRFVKEGLGHIPGQVWLKPGSTSRLQSMPGSLGRVCPHPVPPHCSPG